MCKKYWRTKKHKHTKLQCIIHHPSLAPFFFYSGHFPKSVAFFLVRFSQQICRDLETFILQVVKTTTGDLFQWIRCFRFRWWLVLFSWGIPMDFYGFLWISIGFTGNPRIPKSKHHLFSAIGSLETSIRVSAMGRPLSLVWSLGPIAQQTRLIFLGSFIRLIEPTIFF